MRCPECRGKDPAHDCEGLRRAFLGDQKPHAVYRVRINVDGGAFYYVGDTYGDQDEAYRKAANLSDETSPVHRRMLGICGITVEPLPVK